ncbi:hypothetical protein GCM10009678_37880 [Actinomadura kijaniata]
MREGEQPPWIVSDSPWGAAEPLLPGRTHHSGRNRNGVTRLIPLLDKLPPVRRRVGRPRRGPARLLADRGYDHDEHRCSARAKGINLPTTPARLRSERARRHTVDRTSGLSHWF